MVCDQKEAIKGTVGLVPSNIPFALMSALLKLYIYTKMIKDVTTWQAFSSQIVDTESLAGWQPALCRKNCRNELMILQ